MESSPTDPTVLWRMTRGRNGAHATIFPGDRHNTVTWYFDGVMDRAEQYDSIELAMARAEEIRAFCCAMVDGSVRHVREDVPYALLFL
jgi:hypothetical protein